MLSLRVSFALFLFPPFPPDVRHAARDNLDAAHSFVVLVSGPALAWQEARLVVVVVFRRPPRKRGNQLSGTPPQLPEDGVIVKRFLCSYFASPLFSPLRAASFAVKVREFSGDEERGEDKFFSSSSAHVA